MTRPRNFAVILLAGLLFTLICGLEHAEAQQQTPAPAQTATHEAQPHKVTAYTLPPDEYRKSRQLEDIYLPYLILRPLYGLLILWLLLRWRVAVKYRNLAESKSRNRFLQACIFSSLFLLTTDAFKIPIAILRLYVLRKYGLVVQGWASASLDWAKSDLISLIGGAIVVWLLYAVIRKSPRRWWLYFWLASVPLGLALVLIQPLVIDPMFNKFEPLLQKDPALTVALEDLAQHAGENIPANRIFWMNASAKENSLNAYVTGIGASKRIVVWDTTIAKMTTPQIVAVVGHEMGHYVLEHIWKGVIISALGLLVALYLGYRCIGWLLSRRGAAWGIRGVDDWASLPALAFLLGIITFIGGPIDNAVSRYFEHQADQYALEVTHGLTPDSGQVAAQAFQILGEVDLEYPDPGPLDVFLTYDHPPIRDRVRFSLTYDPWSKGGTGEFVH